MPISILLGPLFNLCRNAKRRNLTMIRIAPSNSTLRWVFALTGLFAVIAGSVGCAGLLLYMIGAASPEVLTVNPYAPGPMASTILTLVCGGAGILAILTCLSDPKTFRLGSWIIAFIALCGAAGFFFLGYIAWPIAIAVTVTVNMMASYTVLR